MTETENLLINYNIDSKNIAIKSYYEADNLWKTLRIERDENKHSAFLAWLFRQAARTYNSPMVNFLNLLVRQMNDEQLSKPGLKELRHAILCQSLVVKNIEISPEKQICQLSKIRYTDRLDLFFKCDIIGVEPYNKLEIILENKIDSMEGNSKSQNKVISPTLEEVAYTKKKQTERYYYACSKECGNRNDAFNPNTTLQLFVFLTSQGNQKPADNNFIIVSYQDLVDYILEPYSKQEDVDEHTKMSINEYLRILGNPYNNNMSTMAITSEERELLIDFYQRNEVLFKKAIEVMLASSESEEEEKDYRNMLNTITKTTRGRRFFVINNGGVKYKMYEVVAEFVKYRLSKGISMADIENDIKSWTKENVCHVSYKKDEVRRGEKSDEANFQSSPFFVTKEWGINENGKNFSGFMTAVNKKYATDFQIAMI